MTSCHDMKKGEIYICEECGIELQVIKECKHSGSTEECKCHDDGDECGFSCCNKHLKKK